MLIIRAGLAPSRQARVLARLHQILIWVLQEASLGRRIPPLIAPLPPGDFLGIRVETRQTQQTRWAAFLAPPTPTRRGIREPRFSAARRHHVRRAFWQQQHAKSAPCLFWRWFVWQQRHFWRPFWVSASVVQLKHYTGTQHRVQFDAWPEPGAKFKCGAGTGG